MCALFEQVTLCANTVKAYRLALVVDVDGVGEEVRTLPINARSGVRLSHCLLRSTDWTNVSSAARCAVPDVVLDTPLLDFQRCFLSRPCVKKVRLSNAGDVPACYSVLEQVRETIRQVLLMLSTGVQSGAKLS